MKQSVMVFTRDFVEVTDENLCRIAPLVAKTSLTIHANPYIIYIHVYIYIYTARAVVWLFWYIEVILHDSGKIGLYFATIKHNKMYIAFYYITCVFITSYTTICLSVFTISLDVVPLLSQHLMWRDLAERWRLRIVFRFLMKGPEVTW